MNVWIGQLSLIYNFEIKEFYDILNKNIYKLATHYYACLVFVRFCVIS